MIGILRRLKALGARLLYHLFYTALRIRQLPAVVRERSPRFRSDQVLVPQTDADCAIVVKYARFDLGEDFIDLLSTLRKNTVNVVVVCNGEPGETARSLIERHACRILVRDNIGRDFGAYRAATLHLHAEGLRPKRVLYFNDSVFYLKGPSLDSLIARLRSRTCDVVGTFENHQYIHHIGTFVFSISGDVFCHPHYQRFWRQYRPFSIRPYAIQHGELKLTQWLKQLGCAIDIVYSAEQLSDRLYAFDLVGLLGVIRYMRPAFRFQSLTQITERSLEARRLGRQITPQGRAGGAPVSITPKLSNYAAHHAASRDLAKVAPVTTEPAETLARDALVDRLMLDITQGSQIHFGFGLFHRLFDCPIIKKDLLARDVYFEHDANLVLDRLPKEARAAIMRELVNRGRPIQVQGFRKFLLTHGFI